MRLANLLSAGAGLVALGVFQAPASAQTVTLLGAACSPKPAAHCPDKGCPGTITNAPGNVMDRKTGRQYFLDYPCDLKPNEKVTFILSLHGGGSIENWQRHYFPIMDFKEKYRLVIATPYGPGGSWQGARDDQHLHNVVEAVEGAVGKDNITAFWLAGHSLGGQTSNRLIMTDPFFTERVDGWVSLSGGRLGSKREDVRATIPRGSPAPGAAAPATTPAATPATGGPPAGGPPGGGPGLAADASVLPEKPFSFIYEAGEHEWTSAGVPKESKWAQKLGCGPQAAKPREIVDVKAGYVFDGRTQENRNKIWGMDPRPGTAKIWDYPTCKDGRIVADISRGDKGHTEGLEPKITEEIVKMMIKAKSP